MRKDRDLNQGRVCSIYVKPGKTHGLQGLGYQGCLQHWSHAVTEAPSIAQETEARRDDKSQK